MLPAICFNLDQSNILLSGNGLKVAFQIVGQKFSKNTKKPSLHPQSLLLFIHKTLVFESQPITREIRDLLWPGRHQQETRPIFT